MNQNAKPAGLISTNPGPATRRRWRRFAVRLASCCLLPLGLFGCQGLGDKMAAWKPPADALAWTDLNRPWGVELPPPPAQSVYRAGNWEKAPAPEAGRRRPRACAG